jgi:ribosomal protein S27E
MPLTLSPIRCPRCGRKQEIYEDPDTGESTAYCADCTVLTLSPSDDD